MIPTFAKMFWIEGQQCLVLMDTRKKGKTSDEPVLRFITKNEGGTVSEMVCAFSDNEEGYARQQKAFDDTDESEARQVFLPLIRTGNRVTKAKAD